MKNQAINTLYRDLSVSSENIKNYKVLNGEAFINELEQEFAKRENSDVAIAFKSFRSARFSLLKLLSKQNSEVLSFDSQKGWEEDLDTLNKKGIQVTFSNELEFDEIREKIANGTISAIYYSPTAGDSRISTNTSQLLSEAFAANISIIIDGSTGGFGHINKATDIPFDYVIGRTSESDELQKLNIGAFIVGYENIHSKRNKNLLWNLKNKRVISSKYRFLYTGDNKVIEKLVDREYHNYLHYAGVAHKLSKILSRSDLVSDVWYNGLGNEVYDKSNLTQESKGNSLRFKLFDVDFGHFFLNNLFFSGKKKGIEIAHNRIAKEFAVEVRTENFEFVKAYFERLFGMLDEELHYRDLLTKQLLLEQKLSEVFGKKVLFQ